MQIPPPRCPRRLCPAALVICEGCRAATGIPFVVIYADYCHKMTFDVVRGFVLKGAETLIVSDTYTHHPSNTCEDLEQPFK